jgi:Family of unknown function (DUF6510)
MQIVENRLDGNAVGGVLREVFTHDVTAAVATCGGCGKPEAVGALHEYGQGMGIVLRCPGCGQVMMRVVRTTAWLRLDMSGVALLEIREGRVPA